MLQPKNKNSGITYEDLHSGELFTAYCVDNQTTSVFMKCTSTAGYRKDEGRPYPITAFNLSAGNTSIMLPHEYKHIQRITIDDLQEV